MNKQFEAFFNQVESLPEEVKNNLLFFWNDDIQNEREFDKDIYNTADRLSVLADGALNDYKAGKTITKGFDEL